MASTFFAWIRSPAAREYFFSSSQDLLAFSCHVFLTSLLRHSFLGTSQSLRAPPLIVLYYPFFQVANFGLPLAAIADLRKDEEVISGTMTATLAFYSCVSHVVPRLPD
jgi:hypothetical protein